MQTKSSSTAGVGPFISFAPVRNDRARHRIMKFGVVITLLSMKRTPEEFRDWSLIKRRIDEQLKGYYRNCSTRGLSPQLIEALKKLDEPHRPFQSPPDDPAHKQ